MHANLFFTELFLPNWLHLYCYRYSYKISNNFTGSAVLIVTTVICRLVAFCCALRHISVQQSPAIIITPKIFSTSSVTDVYVYRLLIFMFTDCFLSQFIMRSVIFQGSSCYHVQLRMLGLLASYCLASYQIQGLTLGLLFQWVFVRTSLYVKNVSYMVHML